MFRGKIYELKKMVDLNIIIIIIIIIITVMIIIVMIIIVMIMIVMIIMCYKWYTCLVISNPSKEPRVR